VNIIEKLYSVFLCLTRDDKYGDRHKRAAIALEIISTSLLTFIFMILVGKFNFDVSNYFVILLSIGLFGFVSYLFFNRYLIKSQRYIRISEETKRYSKKKKISYAFLSVLLMLLSFCFLVGGGILMSYLLSLH